MDLIHSRSPGASTSYLWNLDCLHLGSLRRSPLPLPHTCEPGGLTLQNPKHGKNNDDEERDKEQPAHSH
jgi:hypothetical protein